MEVRSKGPRWPLLEWLRRLEGERSTPGTSPSDDSRQAALARAARLDDVHWNEPKMITGFCSGIIRSVRYNAGN
jgi:hypothetical protein